jgi:hypothetical protein
MHAFVLEVAETGTDKLALDGAAIKVHFGSGLPEAMTKLEGIS